MFECHVTIEPVFDDKLSIAKTIATRNGFRIADLLMKKRDQDTPERSSYDTFMTGYGDTYQSLSDKMTALCVDLKAHGFTIWRYKIEDIILDSRGNDVLNLLG